LTPRRKRQLWRGVGAQRVFGDDDLEMRMIGAELLEPALGGVALAVVFQLSVAVGDHLGKQRDHLHPLGVDHTGTEQLQRVGDLAGLGVGLDQAGGGADLARRVKARAVEADEVVAIDKDEGLERFAALQFAKQRTEGRAQEVGNDPVADDAQLGVARDPLDEVHLVEVGVTGEASLLEGEQRRVLQGEQSEARHQAVGHRDVDVARAPIGDAPQFAPHGVNQCIGIEVVANSQGGARWVVTRHSHGDQAYALRAGMSRKKWSCEMG
jgi:hypothetical protein